MNAVPNGNGAVNRIVWGAAGLFAVALMTIAGIMWNRQLDVSDRLSRLEGKVDAVLARLAPR